MFVTDYYMNLIAYRDLLDNRVARGKLDINKGSKLVDKLNDWYAVAKKKGITN